MEVENAIKDADNDTIAESAEEDTKEEENSSDENNCEYREDEIRNVVDFMDKIRDLQQDILNERKQGNTDVVLFFRGQTNCTWDIKPSIYRSNLLEKEDSLISEAIRVKPEEFRFLSDFEILTKLQHYQLPTRLLDVTTNPLVALYFACNKEHSFSDKFELFVPKKYTRYGMALGAVYYTKAYPKKEEDQEIKAISLLAKTNINSGYTLEDFLKDLVINNIYTKQEADKCRDNKYKSLVDILQKPYFVIPKYSNDRLVRQSGAFLISANCNLQKISDDNNCIIKKAVCNQDTCFDENSILISDFYKSDILNELNFYNINESTLFPELEHQMQYLKESLVGDKQSEEFELYEEDKKDTIIVLPEEINSIIVARDVIYKNIEDSEIKNMLFETIRYNHIVDWYNKETALSKIRFAMKKALKSSGKYSKKQAENLVNYLIKNILNKLREFSIENT